jgi:hypothetical protein
MMTITKARLGRNGDEAIIDDVETGRRDAHDDATLLCLLPVLATD